MFKGCKSIRMAETDYSTAIAIQDFREDSMTS